MTWNGKTAGKKNPKHPLGLATRIKKRTPTIFQKKLSPEQGEKAFNMAPAASRQYPSYRQTSSSYGELIPEKWGA